MFSVRIFEVVMSGEDIRLNCYIIQKKSHERDDSFISTKKNIHFCPRVTGCSNYISPYVIGDQNKLPWDSSFWTAEHACLLSGEWSVGRMGASGRAGFLSGPLRVLRHRESSEDMSLRRRRMPMRVRYILKSITTQNTKFKNKKCIKSCLKT